MRVRVCESRYGRMGMFSVALVSFLSFFLFLFFVCLLSVLSLSKTRGGDCVNVQCNHLNLAYDISQHVQRNPYEHADCQRHTPLYIGCVMAIRLRKLFS